MISSECAAFSLWRYIIVVIVIIYFLLRIRRHFSKLFPQSQCAQSSSMRKEDDIPILMKFKTYFQDLHKLALKVSRDKAFLTQSSDANTFLFNDRTLIDLSKKYSIIQEQMNATLEGARFCKDRQFDESQRMMDSLKTEFLKFKTTAQEALKSSAARSEKESNCSSDQRHHKYSVENITQVRSHEHFCVEQEDQCLSEMHDNENMKIVLLAIKKCIYMIIEESRLNCKNTVDEISSFLNENYRDIKMQLETSERAIKKEEQAACDAINKIAMQTEDIEQQLLNVFLLLDQKVVDVKAIHQTLKFFNRKFVNFSEKCYILWNDICKDHERAVSPILEARENLDRNVEQISNFSYVLYQLLVEIGNILQKDAARTVDGKSKNCFRKIVVSIEDMQGTLENIEKKFCSRLDILFEELKKPVERLEPILQYVEELEVLKDLVKSTCECASMVACPLGTNCPKRIPSLALLEFLESKSYQHSIVSPSDLCDSFSEMNETEETLPSESQTDFISESTDFNRSPSTQIISMLDQVINKTKSELSKTNNDVIKKMKSGNNSASGTEIVSYDELRDVSVWGSLSSDVSYAETSSE